MSARKKMLAREQHVENIVTLYRGYRDATLWGALHNNYDFNLDYQAYSALVRGDAVELRVFTEERTGAVEQWFGKIGFNTETTDQRRRAARLKLDAEWAKVQA